MEYAKSVVAVNDGYDGIERLISLYDTYIVLTVIDDSN